MNFILPLFSGFIGAFLLHVIKEHLLTPDIEIDFADNSAFLPVTRYKRRDNTGKVLSATKAKYLRFRIKNKGKFSLKITARNCRAYISAMEVTDKGGKPHRMGEDWIALSYSSSDAKIIDLPAQVPQFVDMFFTFEDNPGELFCSAPVLLKDYDLLKTPGVFTLEVSIVADNVSIRKKIIKFKWDDPANFESLRAA